MCIRLFRPSFDFLEAISVANRLCVWLKEPDGHDDGLLRSSRPRRAARERSRRLSDNVKSEEEDWRAFSPGPGLRRRSKPNYRELDDDDDELWED